MRRGITPPKRCEGGQGKSRKPKADTFVLRYLRVRSSESNKTREFTKRCRQAFLGNRLSNFQKLFHLRKT